jgi:hypothetical protein
MGIQEFPMTPEEGMIWRGNVTSFKGFGERLCLFQPQQPPLIMALPFPALSLFQSFL